MMWREIKIEKEREKDVKESYKKYNIIDRVLICLEKGKREKKRKRKEKREKGREKKIYVRIVWIIKGFPFGFIKFKLDKGFL